MALTPFLAETGAKIAKKIEENMGLTHYLITETLDPLIDTTTSYNDNNNNDNNRSRSSSSVDNDNDDMNITSKNKRNIINTNLKHSEGKSSNSNSIQGDFVFICGYGKVGQIICEMLDRKFIPYVVIENSPQKAIEARNKGLPVYFGK
jgi:hypothetical protein